MKYKGSVIINKPREVVAELFINPNYNKEYQDGFVKKELIGGVKYDEKCAIEPAAHWR